MFEPETIYHIYNRANGSENLFRENRNYEFFLDKYTYHIDPFVETFAYCLMPNHFHFMMRTGCEKEVENIPSYQKLKTYSRFISKQFGNFFSSYTQAYNKVYHRHGSLFQPNFKKKKADEEDYITQLVVYIHRNPVLHGFVNSPWHWRHSSIHQFFDTTKEKLTIPTKTVIEWFGGLTEFKLAHY